MIRRSVLLVGIFISLATTLTTTLKGQVINRVAGGAIIACTGETDSVGDGCPATQVALSFPTGVFVDASGNIFIADQANGLVRKIAKASGIITTVAGVVPGGVVCDASPCPATSVTLSFPRAVFVDQFGNLFIADSGNQRIVEVSASTGNATTIAGTGTAGYNGDDMPATKAEINFPYGVFVDPSGNVFIADRGNNLIRKVDSTNTITTVAGLVPGATLGCSGNQTDAFGDGCLATQASLSAPLGICTDGAGNLYIADTQDNLIRKVNLLSGIITAYAGNGTLGYNGENIPATSAELNQPSNLFIDTAGSVFFTQAEPKPSPGSNLVRKIDPTGIVSTIAGSPSNTFVGCTGQFDTTGNGCAAIDAIVSTPYGIAGDRLGNLYIADSGDNQIRAISNTIAPGAPLSLSSTNPQSGQVGVPYNAALSVTGGVPPYTWALSPNSTLPPGLSFSLGVITGIPLSPGSYQFTVQVSDSENPVQTAMHTYSFTLAPAGPVTLNVLPQPTTLGLSTANILSTQTFYAQDNAGNYTPVSWTLSLVSGSGSPGNLTPIDDKSITYTAPMTAPTGLVQLTATSLIDPNKSASAQFNVGFNGLGACCVKPGISLQVVVTAGQSGKVGAILSGLPSTGPDSTVVFTFSCTAVNTVSQGTPPTGIGCLFQNKNPALTPGTATGANPITFCTIFTTAASSSTANSPGSAARFRGNSQRLLPHIFGFACFLAVLCSAIWNWGEAISTRHRGYSQVIACALLVVIGVGFIAACGGFSTPNVPAPSFNVTESGDYAVIITATPSQTTSSSGTPFIQSQLLVPLTVQ